MSSASELTQTDIDQDLLDTIQVLKAQIDHLGHHGFELDAIQSLVAQLYNLEDGFEMDILPRVVWPTYEEDWDANGQPINQIGAFLECLESYQERQQHRAFLNRWPGWTGWAW